MGHSLLTELLVDIYSVLVKMQLQGEGYPDPSAFCSNTGHVLAEKICFILLCQNIAYITTKGRGVRVSHPVIMAIGIDLDEQYTKRGSSTSRIPYGDQ